VRLNGDVQTDILRCWLNRTSHQSVGELVERHFQSVVDATRGWSAARGGIRLGTQLIIALGMVAGIASAIPPALQAEWELLVPALLTNWRVLSGISITAFGFLLRWALRLWLRWKFQGSLSMG
jgi:hypothetical protein